MPTDLKLEKFEGPLDFLLQLIDQEKLSITEIALSQITEQYFSYLDKLEETRSEELADFLVIAARLIYIKSNHLLNLFTPEEDSGPSLADQLKMYKKYVDASKEIERLWNAGSVAYGRMEPPVKAKEFVLPINAGTESLRGAMVSLLSRLKPLEPLPQVTIDYSISVKQTIDNLRHLLKTQKNFSFRNVLGSAQNRTEVIVSFLALLELVKEKTVKIKQANAFEDMIVSKI